MEVDALITTDTVPPLDLNQQLQRCLGRRVQDGKGAPLRKSYLLPNPNSDHRELRFPLLLYRLTLTLSLTLTECVWMFSFANQNQLKIVRYHRNGYKSLGEHAR
jgi:hypothetical protein